MTREGEARDERAKNRKSSTPRSSLISITSFRSILTKSERTRKREPCCWMSLLLLASKLSKTCCRRISRPLLRQKLIRSPPCLTKRVASKRLLYQKIAILVVPLILIDRRTKSENCKRHPTLSCSSVEAKALKLRTS